jgi:hypothetical protein
LVVGLVGGGVLAAPIVAHAASAPSNNDDVENGSLAASATAAGGDARALLHPLVPGDKIGRWTFVHTDSLKDGALAVALRSEEAPDHVFYLEVMAKDGSAHAAAPPAETRQFAVFVRNGGDGWLPTEEDQGLAAMTLSALIERNERSGDAMGLRTHAARLAKTPEN